MTYTREGTGFALLAIMLVIGTVELFAWPCGNETWSQEAREPSPDEESRVARLTEFLRPETPPFPTSDSERVARALDLARQLFSRHGEKVRELVVAALGGAESDEVVDWFLSQYAAKLNALAPEERLYDGRRCGHLLPTARVTIKQFFGRDRHLAALVTEIELGEHAIFVGPRFFEIPLETQAQLLLHETLHMLGKSFGDEALDPVLHRYSWYDPRAFASDNLQRFFQEFCR